MYIFHGRERPRTCTRPRSTRLRSNSRSSDRTGQPPTNLQAHRSQHSVHYPGDDSEQPHLGADLPVCNASSHLPDTARSARRKDVQRQPVRLADISPHLYRAVIASEDQAFCMHNGFDWAAIAKARDYNEQSSRTRGASTITMQTAKNAFLWPSRSWTRKGVEAYFTLLIEGFWPKHRILEVYLNVAEWGPGIFGAEAAAHYHFGKPAARLTAHEAALLAAALPSPLRSQPGRPSGYLEGRAREINSIADKIDAGCSRR